MMKNNGAKQGGVGRKEKSPTPRNKNLHADESRDPYLNEQPEGEPARCSVCGNIYANKRWYRADQYELEEGENALNFTCPGCRKVKDNYYYGELRVSGTFAQEHHGDISGLIQNEVHRRQEKNPLSKLVEVEIDRGKKPEIVFHTTNGKLAENIGRALKNAFGGELTIKKPKPLTRVYWSRK